MDIIKVYPYYITNTHLIIFIFFKKDRYRSLSFLSFMFHNMSCKHNLKV